MLNSVSFKSVLPIILMLMSFFLATSQTQIIAHRGFSGIAPENTLISFKKAIEIGADYIEFDVHKSKDGKLFVIHDESVRRTSSNQMLGNIAEMTSTEIGKIKVGYSKKFGKTFKKEKIPTLREVLKLARHKTKVCIELKVHGIENEVLKTIDDLKMHDEVIIFSFYVPVLVKIRELDSKIPILYLIAKGEEESITIAKEAKFNAIGVGSKTIITPEFLNYAHDFGIEVWKWTVNSEEEMKELIQIGLDGIITNYPDKALHLLNVMEK